MTTHEQKANELAERIAELIHTKFGAECVHEVLVKQIKQLILQDLNLANLLADKERLEALVENQWYVSWSSDGEVCNVWKQADRDGEAEPVEGYPQKCYNDWRTAIRDAMNKDAAITEKGGDVK